MRVLIIKNIFSEGPGTIAEHLLARGIPFAVVDLSAGDDVPDPDQFSHFLVMGGPMAVYEMLTYPHLVHEALLIDRAIKMDKHVLGICLGAQMIAHVLGSRVYPGSRKEIGWSEVELTRDGLKDPGMSALTIPGRDRAQVFQWHGDTFDLPAGAVCLASSELYQNQAFLFRDRVYALQFHIEVTPAMVQEWLKNEKGIDVSDVAIDSERIFPGYRERAERFYQGFFIA